jgi:hypothetical protein
VKRIGYCLAFLLCLVSRALAAHDGPTPRIVYDQTQNGVHLVVSTQSKVLNGGYTRSSRPSPITIYAGFSKARINSARRM